MLYSSLHVELNSESKPIHRVTGPPGRPGTSFSGLQISDVQHLSLLLLLSPTGFSYAFEYDPVLSARVATLSFCDRS